MAQITRRFNDAKWHVGADLVSARRALLVIPFLLEYSFLYCTIVPERHDMKILVDTSVLIAVVLGEPKRDSMIKITRNAHLIAPASLRWEVGNAFSAMFRKKCITLKEAIEAVKIFEMIPVEEILPDLTRSVEIAHARNIYAYDAYMLDIALSYKVPLLTLDDGLARVARTMKIHVLEV
jgi:predicted nucleic acid-binding protein